MGYEIVGELEGDVMGDLEGDVMGELDGEVIGAVVRKPGGGHKMVRVRKTPGRNMLALPAKPGWRKQLAPGVPGPTAGFVPLPLAGQAGSPPGLFTATLSQITFQGQLQKPYQAKRLLVSSVRSGASAIGRLLGVLYVGTDLQQAEIAGWDIELVGQPNSFDTSLTCNGAEPGVLIRMVVNLSQNLTGTDTIYANLTFLGEVIH